MNLENGKHVKTLSEGHFFENEVGHTGCGECQTSCQSACKTSCTVGNQVCENEETEEIQL